jgi:hypothetical protein
VCDKLSSKTACPPPQTTHTMWVVCVYRQRGEERATVFISTLSLFYLYYVYGNGDASGEN